jgi:hypothetical protein
MGGFYMVTVGAALFSGGNHMWQRDWQTCAPKHDKRDEVVDVAKAVAGADTELNNIRNPQAPPVVRQMVLPLP